VPPDHYPNVLTYDIVRVCTYLVGEYTLADVAHAGNFHRLRELAERGEVSLGRCPNVATWMGRVESRESYKAST
jgi:glutathione S-transferase